MKKIMALTLSASLASMSLAGCATGSKDISSSYTSPMQYQGYDCQQINAETLRLQSKVSQLGGRLDQAASNDKAIMAAGALLFWPALFALGGTKQQEAEYATLKGQHDAIQQASIEKKCEFRPASVMPSTASTGEAKS